MSSKKLAKEACAEEVVRMLDRVKKRREEEIARHFAEAERLKRIFEERTARHLTEDIGLRRRPTESAEPEL
jgi:hypothetical protein